MQALQAQRCQGAQRVVGRGRSAAQQQSVSLRGRHWVSARQQHTVAKTPQAEESEVWILVKPPTGLP